MIAFSLSGYLCNMYPDRESVERLDADRGQDEALLAARGRTDADHLGAEERPDGEPDDEAQAQRDEG
ncbi:hypothetical protein [Allorhizocola rhizosphaerae]|uniref:hypothetical protein n=1 Tax=Allorhizocola rhizosphaerae TaxID=1872709 RepID=UPI000E3E5957|nr:hypothetical protein [Allorhizocola rhizosphaerae]